MSAQISEIIIRHTSSLKHCKTYDDMYYVKVLWLFNYSVGGSKTSAHK